MGRPRTAHRPADGGPRSRSPRRTAGAFLLVASLGVPRPAVSVGQWGLTLPVPPRLPCRLSPRTASSNSVLSPAHHHLQDCRRRVTDVGTQALEADGQSSRGHLRKWLTRCSSLPGESRTQAGSQFLFHLIFSYFCLVLP